MARPTRKLLRDRQRRPAQAQRSVRRLPITGGDARAMTLEGGEGLGTDTEAPEPEVFGVAGVLSRPDGGPEAIVVAIGGDGHDVIIATRDHAWAVAVQAAGMPVGETWLFNRKAFVRIKVDGNIEIGRPDGSFEAVTTVSHIHTSAVAGSPTSGALPNPLGNGIAGRVKAETPGVP